MGKQYIIDIESNGLLMEATRIWCIVFQDINTNEIFPYGPDQLDLALERLGGAETLIGHNIVLYDLPLLKRLHGISYDSIELIDTLLWSRFVDPERRSHSLDSYGQQLGFPKTEFKDFNQFSDEMLEYCINDVEVSRRVYNYFKGKFIDTGKYAEAAEIEHRFAAIISLQILNGFKLDVPHTESLYKELEGEYETLYTKLVSIMPQVRVDGHYQSVKKVGRLLSENDSSYCYTTEKTEQIKTKDFKFVDANPRSRQQIIAFFIDKYNWSPQKFTDKDNPQVDESVLAELDYPEAVLISRLFRLNKQMAMMGPKSGWLSFVIDGRVHGNMITNGAVTGRCTHSKPNMAQVDKKDIRMRDCWVTKEGWDLVSADAEQLEARLLAHYLTPYDDGTLTKILLEGDFHTQNQEFAQFASRNSAKTLLYGFIYGAGDAKLAKIAMQDSNYENYKGNMYALGKKMRESLIDSMTGIDKLQQMIALTLGQRDHLLGLDGRPLYIRSQHASLNTLLQSGGAVIMKLTLIKWYDIITSKGLKHGVDYGLCANVHDEIVFESRPEVTNILCDSIKQAIREVVDDLKFKCPLEMNYQKGKRWGEIH